MGNAKGCKNAAVVILGTGIGGGIVINGHVHRGKDLSAGELSYFFADTLTRKDVDKIFDIDSISDMEEEYEKLPYLWSTSYSTRAFCYQVAVAKGINPKEFNGELLYKMAEEGDPVVLDMLENFLFHNCKISVQHLCHCRSGYHLARRWNKRAACIRGRCKALCRKVKVHQYDYKFHQG